MIKYFHSTRSGSGAVMKQQKLGLASQGAANANSLTPWSVRMDI